MMEQIVSITFPTHEVRASRRDGKTLCWKINEDRVDFEVFDTDESALEYIITPFPTIQWHLTLEEV
jgi:hypothetical protein